jgi:hypothetical protein
VWPWLKTQEAGFSHCASQAMPICEWVAFIDLDEFLFPSSYMKGLNQQSNVGNQKLNVDLSSEGNSSSSMVQLHSYDLIQNHCIEIGHKCAKELRSLFFGALFFCNSLLLGLESV